MKRQILLLCRGVSGCCPGHDTYPEESYKNRRSKRARAQGKKMEHRFVRRLLKQKLHKEL